MKRILFVDDDANVVQGLQRLLRSQRHEWQIEFTSSGPQALQILDGTAYDVIVSDMRMPGMSGAELLQEVSRRFPQMVRIILSGQSDQENIIRSVGSTHRYLAKPCNAAILKETIARACNLRHQLASEPLQNLMSRIQCLPSVPRLYTAIVEAMDRPDASTNAIGTIIARDVAMTAKMLQLVNSAFFGLQRQVSDPIQAVQVLGLDTIRALVLSSSVFLQFQTSVSPGISLEALWHHSMLVGTFAKQIAREQGQNARSLGEVYSAGLLHDVGKLAIAANLPNEYAQAMRLAAQKDMTHQEAERITLGADHSEVGAYLMGLWGLPDTIVEAIAFHHMPSVDTECNVSALTAVHLADVFAHAIQHQSTDGRHPPMDLAYLDRLDLSDRIPQWRELCNRTYRGDAN